MGASQARGEAEAEYVLVGDIGPSLPIDNSNRLAFLNASGAIDAVMTDDADAFVFGGTCVIKKYL